MATPTITVAPLPPSIEPAVTEDSRRARKARRKAAERSVRTLASPMALRTRKGKTIYWTVFTVVLVAFVIGFLFPLYWMVTGAMKSTQELVTTPPTIVPQVWHPSNFASAWDQMNLAQYLGNTALQAGGAWLLQLVFLTMAAYALSKLKPVFGQIILGAIVATLMVPASALLVPKYLTVVSLPFTGTNLLNSPLAIWLPAVANAFNLYLLKRFFDQIPSEMMEAAALDGAGALRTLWSIVLPMARPVLGVVSIFAIVAVWQDFLWPLLVFTDTTKQPISVAVVQLQANLPMNLTLAALVLASIPMVVIFLIFQRHIVAGISAGSLKG
ncbi:MAG TPA: carbohydrate ABC transporter permease [Pseudonocardiaceae bacterium]|jgi:multiple sugar transport system permease protein|nr:carbohydrate ABC transporter permease [Pseudonocardiaceae bacterium]